jgi:peptidoglycan/xylan/chitin deacetylase (PgdA/CDA1 family)
VFREHLCVISRRFQTSGWPAKSGACVITLDDGYLNQWEIAGPILNEFKIPAIYFVPFKPIEEGKCLIIDDLLKWFSYAPHGSYKVFGETVVLAQNSRGDTFDEIYRDLLDHPARWFTIRSELDNAVKFADLKVDVELERLRFTPLQLSQLAKMRAAGHQIGCHSWEHLPLASLSPQQLARDFERCVSKIDRYANTQLYCYPFGSNAKEVSHEATMQCSRNGFQWAFLNTDSIAELRCDPKYAVPRMTLPNTAHRYLLEAKLSGLEGILKRMLQGWTSVLRLGCVVRRLRGTALGIGAVNI